MRLSHYRGVNQCSFLGNKKMIQKMKLSDIFFLIFQNLLLKNERPKADLSQLHQNLLYFRR